MRAGWVADSSRQAFNRCPSRAKQCIDWCYGERRVEGAANERHALTGLETDNSGDAELACMAAMAPGCVPDIILTTQDPPLSLYGGSMRSKLPSTHPAATSWGEGAVLGGAAASNLESSFIRCMTDLDLDEWL